MAREKNKINISKEKREEMTVLIKNYFLNEREETIGDLAADLLLDFIIEKIAPEFYNQGVYDSYTYMTGSIEDLLSIQKL